MKRDRQLYMSLALLSVFPCFSCAGSGVHKSWLRSGLAENWPVLEEHTAELGSSGVQSVAQLHEQYCWRGERKQRARIQWPSNPHLRNRSHVLGCDVWVFMLKRDRPVILENFLSAMKFSTSETFQWVNSVFCRKLSLLLNNILWNPPTFHTCKHTCIISQYKTEMKNILQWWAVLQKPTVFLWFPERNKNYSYFGWR